MKKPPASQQSRSLKLRLAAYSATAGAAMACAPSAQATLTPIVGGDSGNFVFNGTTVPSGGPPTFTLTTTGGVEASWGIQGLVTNRLHGAHRNTQGSALIGFSVAATNGSLAQRFALNANIATVAHSFITEPFLAHNTGFSRRGNFPLGDSSGYIGFRFAHSAKQYYGWMKVKMGFSTGSNHISSTVTFLPVSGDIYGAYGLMEDNVKAGVYTAVPEPSTMALAGLSLLALGAVGVRELRRHRSLILKVA